LSWPQFRKLETGFNRWLCGHYFVFDNCAAWFADDFQENVATFWKLVLKDADFSEFAEQYLNESSKRNSTVAFDDEISMNATQIGPGEVLSISWGITAAYPELGSGLSSGYARPSMGGTTQLSISDRDGLRLLPATVFGDLPQSEDKTLHGNDKNYELPFKPQWASLFGGSPPVFLPIFNMFDLHDPRLLRDKTGHAPSRLFLLSPGIYTKADSGPYPLNIAQYTTDARTQGKAEKPFIEARQLARRFLLIGCVAVDIKCPEDELAALRSQAVAALSNGPAVGQPTYAVGAFANQTFVEVRYHISINGRPREVAVLAGETWGSIVATWMLSGVNRTGSRSSGPILEIRRTMQDDDAPSQTMRIRFYTTDRAVMDEAEAFEGDEFYAQPHIQTILR